MSASDISRDWRLIYFLIGLTLVSALLSVLVSQAVGTYSYWTVLGLLFVFSLLLRRYWSGFLVVIAAFGTVSVFQAGVIVGYKSWHYAIILAAIFLAFRSGTGFFRMSGFKWWFLLALLGALHLFFIEDEEAFSYSRSMVVNIAAGLSAFAMAHHIGAKREQGAALHQISFLVAMVGSIALLVPVSFPPETSGRLGPETGMDANGIGITVVYSFIALFIYASVAGGKRKIIVASLVTVFLVVVVAQTASRQAVSALFLLFGMYFFFSLRGKIKLQYLIVLTSLFVGLSVFSVDANLPYLKTRFEKVVGPEGSIDRVDHLRMSLYMIADHPLGLGGGGFREHFGEYKYAAGVNTPYRSLVPHTLFGMVIAEWGLPGIFLLLGGFFMQFKYVFTLRGLDFQVKFPALLIYFFLANAGLVFPPVLMAILGMPSYKEPGAAAARTVRW